MAKKMDKAVLLDALKRVAVRLGDTEPQLRGVEVLLVGGAAGIVMGLFRDGRVTADCDLILAEPAGADVKVEAAAAAVARDLGLEENWLNATASFYKDIMLPGWVKRRRWIASFGPLKVYAVGRLDLLALKFYAHRDQDIEDLDDLGVSADEAAKIRAHLLACLEKGFTREQINPALEFLSAYMEGR